LTIAEDGRFWAVDSGNHRLVIFSEKGDVEFTVGGLGAKEGRFHGPSDITIGRFDKVYVADSRNRRIQVLRADGSFLESWDSRTGGRRKHLEIPRALAYTEQARGGIWVANRGWQRLERFDLDGEWIESLDLSELVEGEVKVEGLAIDPVYHRMFVSDAAGGRLIVLDRRGALLAVLRGPGETRLEPGGAAVSRKFDLYVPDAAGARVLKYEAGSGPAQE
jgi:sugar lactone lactonase YvrE